MNLCLNSTNHNLMWMNITDICFNSEKKLKNSANSPELHEHFADCNYVFFFPYNMMVITERLNMHFKNASKAS